MSEVNEKLFNQFAHDNPGQVLAMQTVPDAKTVLPRWVMDAAPTSTILPEWLKSAKAQAIEKLDSQGKAIDASVSADRGKLEAQIVQAKAAGQPINGMLSTYMAHGGRQEFYEAFTGEQWIRSNPALRDQFISQLRDVKPEEVPFIIDQAAMSRGRN